MKIALCFSGQPRSVEKTFPLIKKNILDSNNPDVFIHSWIDQNIKQHIPIAASGAPASDTIPENIEELILDLYKPTKYIFEPQIEFNEKNYASNKAMFIRPKSSISQLYSIFKSIELAKDYDIIIRMRLDWGIQTLIDVSNLDLNKISAPNDCPHAGGINDQFAIGTNSSMKIYSELYDKFDEYFTNDNISFCNEILLGHHLRKNSIEVNLIPIAYEIIRHSTDAHKRFNENYIKYI